MSLSQIQSAIAKSFTKYFFFSFFWLLIYALQRCLMQKSVINMETVLYWQVTVLTRLKKKSAFREKSKRLPPWYRYTLIVYYSDFTTWAPGLLTCPNLLFIRLIFVCYSDVTMWVPSLLVHMYILFVRVILLYIKGLKRAISYRPKYCYTGLYVEGLKSAIAFWHKEHKYKWFTLSRATFISPDKSSTDLCKATAWWSGGVSNHLPSNQRPSSRQSSALTSLSYILIY